jgi:hypothetical protein
MTYSTYYKSKLMHQLVFRGYTSNGEQLAKTKNVVINELSPLSN